MPFAKLYLKSSELMNEVDTESVALIITTPPEWDIDLHNGEPIIRPATILQECYRVLRKGGVFIYNVGMRPLKSGVVPQRDALYVRNFYDGLSAIRIRKICPEFWPIANVVHAYSGVRKYEIDQLHFSKVYAARHEHWLLFAKGS